MPYLFKMSRWAWWQIWIFRPHTYKFAARQITLLVKLRRDVCLDHFRKFPNSLMKRLLMMTDLHRQVEVWREIAGKLGSKGCLVVNLGESSEFVDVLAKAYQGEARILRSQPYRTDWSCISILLICYLNSNKETRLPEVWRTDKITDRATFDFQPEENTLTT